VIAYCCICSPEPLYLENTIEDGIFHVLHITFSSWNRSSSSKVLPSDDGCEEHSDWNCPRHEDYRQHLRHAPQSVIMHSANYNKWKIRMCATILLSIVYIRLRPRYASNCQDQVEPHA